MSIPIFFFSLGFWILGVSYQSQLWCNISAAMMFGQGISEINQQYQFRKNLNNEIERLDKTLDLFDKKVKEMKNE